MDIVDISHQESEGGNGMKDTRRPSGRLTSST